MTISPSIRPAAWPDHELLAEFLAGLSPESAHRRFLGSLVTPPARAFLAALLPQQPLGGALFALAGDRAVGHAMWIRLRDPAVAELAVVVADEHQRQGVGSALATALMAQLRAHRVEEVQVLSSWGNRAVARMVARHAPHARRELDGSLLTYSFATPADALRRTA